MRTSDTVRASSPEEALAELKRVSDVEVGDVYLLKRVEAQPTPYIDAWAISMEWEKIGNQKENASDTSARDRIIKILLDEEDTLSDGYFWYCGGSPRDKADTNQAKVYENLLRIAEKILAHINPTVLGIAIQRGEGEPVEVVSKGAVDVDAAATSYGLELDRENPLPPKTIVESTPTGYDETIKRILEGIRGDVREIRETISERVNDASNET